MTASEQPQTAGTGGFGQDGLSFEGIPLIRRTFRGIVQLLGALGAGLAVMLMVVAWQLSSGPISLGFLSPHIESFINSGQRDFKLAMKDTILTWAGWERALDIRVLDVKILRSDGLLVGSIPEVSFSLSGRALIRGLLAPQSVELFGPRLRVSRDLGGGFGVGFEGTESQSKDLRSRSKRKARRHLQAAPTWRAPRWSTR